MDPIFGVANLGVTTVPHNQIMWPIQVMGSLQKDHGGMLVILFPDFFKLSLQLQCNQEEAPNTVYAPYSIQMYSNATFLP